MTAEQELPEKWPAPWVRALLPIAVLSCLAEMPAHGYGIAAQLAERGFGKPKGGALYPHLVALEEAGDVRAEWTPGQGGPGRKEYAITSQGRERLTKEASWLRHLVQNLHPTD